MFVPENVLAVVSLDYKVIVLKCIIQYEHAHHEKQTSQIKTLLSTNWIYSFYVLKILLNRA